MGHTLGNCLRNTDFWLPPIVRHPLSLSINGLYFYSLPWGSNLHSSPIGLLPFCNQARLPQPPGLDTNYIPCPESSSASSPPRKVIVISRPNLNSMSMVKFSPIVQSQLLLPLCSKKTSQLLLLWYLLRWLQVWAHLPFSPSKLFFKLLFVHISVPSNQILSKCMFYELMKEWRNDYLEVHRTHLYITPLININKCQMEVYCSHKRSIPRNNIRMPSKLL